MSKVTCGFDDYYSDFLQYVEETAVGYLESRLGRKIELERGKDGRLHIPPEWSNLYPVSTDELIARDDFAPNFKRGKVVNNDCPYDWEMYVDDINDLAKPEINRNRHLHVYPGNTKGNTAKFYLKEGIEEAFLEDMTFRDKFVIHAQDQLHKVKLEYLKKKSSAKKKARELVFVGVHCRRTDHIEFEQRRGIPALNVNYFIESMDMFRQWAKKQNKVKSQGKIDLAFVFVSDDMDWGREKLKVRNKERDLYFVGNGKTEDPDGIGQDLALLASCNHTIQSHGSFSAMAGILSGGLRILPEHFPQFRTADTQAKILTLDPFENPLPRIYFFSEMEQIVKDVKNQL